MEKITFPPLIAILQENTAALNQLLSTTAATSRKFNAVDIHSWFVTVVEPVFAAVYQHDQACSRKVFDILFRDMLRVLFSGRFADDIELQRDCRLILTHNPKLAAANMARILSAFTVALKKISQHSHQAARAWLEIMQKIMPLAEDVDQLLAAGRLAAWRCGMAHLRYHKNSSNSLDQKIVSIIFAEDRSAKDQLQQRWSGRGNVNGIAAGCFTGFGGVFVRPPRVTLHDEIIFTSDHSQIRALFADRFGCLLAECADEFKDELNFKLQPPAGAAPAVAKILAGYEDLTSWVYHDFTLYLTVGSSHSVFIFGAIDG